MATLPTETTEIEKNTPLPQAVVAVEKIPQWLNQTRLRENPFTDFITTTNDEKESFAHEGLKSVNKSILSSADRLKKDVPEATTEAQWRNDIHYQLSALNKAMGRWQMWHQLWLCASNGWLGGPLWKIRTRTQVRKLADMMIGHQSLSERTLSGSYRDPSKKDFKTMGIQSDRDWEALAHQLDGAFTVDDVQVNVGRVPLPHNETTYSGNAVVLQYLYRTGRLGEPNGDEDALFDNNLPKDDESTVEVDPDSVSEEKPPPESANLESENDSVSQSSDEENLEAEEALQGGLQAEPVSDDDVPAVHVDEGDAQRFHEKAKTRIYSNFSDVKAVKMRHIKEKAWMRGYPNPWDMFGEFVESYNGIQRYEYNRGEKHDNRKENYILDLHTGYIWLVPGVEGFGVYKALTKVYEDTDAEISSALAWMRLSKNEALEAQSRHTRLEYLLQRAENNGMHSVHELFENEQAGVGPPPSSRRLDNLEKRIQNFETAEEKIQANQNTPSNEAMSQ